MSTYARGTDPHEPLDAVLRAATVPGHLAELAGEEKAMAAFRTAVPGPRRRSLFARVLTVKVLIVGAVATSTGVVLAAAGGVLPALWPEPPPATSTVPPATPQTAEVPPAQKLDDPATTEEPPATTTTPPTTGEPPEEGKPGDHRPRPDRDGRDKDREDNAPPSGRRPTTPTNRPKKRPRRAARRAAAKRLRTAQPMAP